MASVSATMQGPSALGSRCLKMMRISLDPMERAASTNSFCLMESTCPRMIRAIPSQFNMPIAMKMKNMPPSAVSICTIACMRGPVVPWRETALK